MPNPEIKDGIHYRHDTICGALATLLTHLAMKTSDFVRGNFSKLIPAYDGQDMKLKRFFVIFRALCMG